MMVGSRKIAFICSGLIVLIGLAVLIALLSGGLDQNRQLSSFPGLDTVEFELPATTGETISNRDLLGAPVAMFYGFTNCPEICPVTLYNLSQIIDNIGEDAESIKLVFVTVDPERDTIAVLTEYLNAINDKAIGLSGEPKALAAMRQKFGIFAEATSRGGHDNHAAHGDHATSDDNYDINHTATVFLYDAKGKLGGTIAWGEPYEFAEAKIIQLLAKR